MRPLPTCSALLIAVALTLPAAEVTPLPAPAPGVAPVPGIVLGADARPADPQAEPQPDAPADPVTDLRQRFTQLMQDRPVLAKTDSLARFDKAIALVVAAQEAVTAAATLDSDGFKRTQLAAQTTFEQRLLALDLLVNETELTADLADAQAKLDAHPLAVAKDDVGKRLAAVRVELREALAEESAARIAAQHLRQQADSLDLYAEELDAQADQRAQAAEQAAENVGKINELEGKVAHAKELAAARARQIAAVRLVHEAQSEALHQRQEAELVRLKADAIDDQAEQTNELFDAQREALGQINEAIDQAVEALAQPGADK